MPAQHAADGPRNKADGKAAECSDGARQRIASDRKEELAEDERRRGAVKKKVIPLEDLPEHGGGDRAAHAALVARHWSRGNGRCTQVGIHCVRVHGVQSMKEGIPA